MAKSAMLAARLAAGVGALLLAVGSAMAAPCRALTFEGNDYTVCEVDLARQEIRLFWKGPADKPFGYLSSLPPRLGGPLQFAVNAGMYHPDLSPVGLYVEGGRDLVRASTANGPGNFHMKPNGVFYVAGGKAAVAETQTYLRLRPHAELATQSGPMLVINGRLHPRFRPTGQSRKLRNGVGVDAAGKVVFAISSGEVTFTEFARLFHAGLHCANALYLDGSISTLYAPSLGRGSNVWPLGPMFGVYERSGGNTR